MYGMNVDQYAQRLDRIELAVWCLAALLLVTILLVLAHTARAFRRRIVLRDRKGVARLSVGMTDADEPEITLWGRDAKSWARVTCDSDGFPSLAASDRAGRGRLSLTVSESGPYLCMLDGDGNPSMQAGMLQGDVPGVLIRDKAGRHRFDLCLDDAGAPYLVLFEGERTRRLAVGISPDAEPALVFFDRRGEERIGVGFGANGEPFLHVLDEAGNVVNQIHPAQPGAGSQSTKANGTD
jgi:hypothetical protein